jgi:hypothetical protein
VATALIEPTLEGRTVFRVTLPSLCSSGTAPERPADSGAFFNLLRQRCMADYAAAPELTSKLKSGKLLLFQLTNLAAKARSVCIVWLTVECATSFSSGRACSSLPAPLAHDARLMQRPCIQ